MQDTSCGGCSAKKELISKAECSMHKGIEEDANAKKVKKGEAFKGHGATIGAVTLMNSMSPFTCPHMTVNTGMMFLNFSTTDHCGFGQLFLLI
jgi:hypothetical protein